MSAHLARRPGVAALLALSLLSQLALPSAAQPSLHAPPGSAAPTGPAAQPDGSLPSQQEIWDPALLRRAGLDPDRIACRASVLWGDDLRAQAREVTAQIVAALPPGRLQDPGERQRFSDAASEISFWRLVRVLLIDGQNHNAGVIALRGFHWRDAAGRPRPLLVFRSAITSVEGSESSCVASLLRHGEVRHVANLYTDDKIPAGQIMQQEAALARRCGASYLRADEAAERYGRWRQELRSALPGSAAYRRNLDRLALLIREQILAPGGRPPEGNIYLHCGGGMHRTGMVMGILERCVNGASMQAVTRRYRWHTAWRGPQNPGGAEDGNLEVIARFDCGSLGPLPAGS